MQEYRFNGRLGIVQRVLPSYRASFFDALAAACKDDLALFAGQPRPDEAIPSGATLERARLFNANNFHFLTTSNPFYFCYQRGLIDWLKLWNPDALIVEANFRYLSSSTGFRWMKQRKRPVIGWGLGAPLERGLLSPLRRGFLNQFDAMIAYSQRGAEQYAALGIADNRIFVAPNAVTSAPSRPIPNRPASFSGQPVMLFVGRLQARKRIPALLKACAELPPEIKPRLIIVGDGPESANLRALAQDLYPLTEFTGGKHDAQLEPYFIAADLFILPGTGGLAVQQAMSYGLPVIVAQGDGTQDDLVRPGNGWLIPPNDDIALSATLREALSDVSLLRTMGAESYRIVSKEINLEKMVSVFVQALNSIDNI